MIDIAGGIEPDDLEPDVLGDLVSLYRRWQSD